MISEARTAYLLSLVPQLRASHRGSFHNHSEDKALWPQDINRLYPNAFKQVGISRLNLPAWKHMSPEHSIQRGLTACRLNPQIVSVALGQSGFDISPPKAMLKLLFGKGLLKSTSTGSFPACREHFPVGFHAEENHLRNKLPPWKHPRNLS